MGNKFPDYMVTAGERRKLLTRKQLVLGSVDNDWHHPVLVNIGSVSENPNTSDKKLKARDN